MIAAIYARKSTEQHGVADEQKSVACQVEHARVSLPTDRRPADDELPIFAKLRELHRLQPARVRLLTFIVADMLREADGGDHATTE